MFYEVYESLKTSFKQYEIRIQHYSIGMKIGELNIDIVPARLIDVNSRDANLFDTERKTCMKTNVAKQKEVISESRHRDVMKIMKIWKNLHNVNIKSFTLEIIVIKVLAHSMEDLDTQVYHILSYLDTHFGTESIIDPGNSNNNLLDGMTRKDINDVRNKAASSLSCKYWGDIIW